MASVLYLLEMYMNSITFEAVFEPMPLKKDILINARFSDIMNINLSMGDILHESKEFTYPEGLEIREDPDDEEERQMIPMNVGKTYLFISTSETLLVEMSNYPLELTLELFKKKYAVCKHKFKKSFLEAIKVYMEKRSVNPTGYSATLTFKVEDDTTSIATLDVQLRLSCYGKHITTLYQFEDETNPNSCTFVNSFNNKSVVMNNLDGGVIKQAHNIMSLLSQTTQPPPETGSWLSLGFPLDNKVMVTGPVWFEEESTCSIYTNSSFDVVSMVVRPPEKKFMDLMQYVSAEVTAHDGRNTIITLTMEKIPQKMAREKKVIQRGKCEHEADDPLLCLSNSCGNEKCPAAFLFKKLGKGPLAETNPLGTVMGDVKDSCYLGVSQTYGSGACYGPLGLLGPTETNLAMYYDKIGETALLDTSSREQRLYSYDNAPRRALTEYWEPRMKRGNDLVNSSSKCSNENKCDS